MLILYLHPSVYTELIVMYVSGQSRFSERQSEYTYVEGIGFLLLQHKIIPN